MAAAETFHEFRNFITKSLGSFPKLASRKGWRAWEYAVGQACAAVGLENLLTEEKQPAITVLDTDASVADYNLAYSKYIYAVKLVGVRIREAIPENYQEAHDLLAKFTRAQLLTDVVVHANRAAAINIMVTLRVVDGVPLAHNYPHPCRAMAMLRERMTSRLPAEQNAEIDKFHAIRVIAGDYEGMIDCLRSQARLLADLGIPMSDPALRAQICKAIDKHAQPLVDTLTSNAALTTDELIRALSAHYKTRAVNTGTSKRAASEDAVALCASVSEQVPQVGGRSRNYTQFSPRGRGSSRGRASNRGSVSPRGRGRGGSNVNQDRDRCYSCGRVGHYKKNCRFTQETKEDNKTGDGSLSKAMSTLSVANIIYCTRCGAIGHTEDKCRLTKRVQKLQARLANIEREGSVETLMVRVLQNGGENYSQIFKFQLDSASDRHLVPFVEYLVEKTVTKLAKPIRVGGINALCPLYATHTGTLRIPLQVEGATVWEDIDEVLVVPKLPCSIISLGFFQGKGYDVHTTGVKNQIAGHTHVLVKGKIRLEGTQQIGSARTYVNLADGGKYFKELLAGEVVSHDPELFKNSNSSLQVLIPHKDVVVEREEKKSEKKRKIEEELILLHKRLGHPSPEVLLETCKKYFPFPEDVANIREMVRIVQKCEACLLGKAKRIPHPTASKNRSSTPGEVWHYDTFGPSREASLSGNRYAGILSDDFSMYSFVDFAQHKNQLPAKMVPTLRYLSKTFNVFTKFRSDNAPEFKVLWNVCNELGVLVEKTVPGESAQNAVVERAIGVITEKARVLLLQSGARRGFWAEAFLYASMLNNILAHRRLGWRAPVDVLFGTPVRLEMFKPFGCTAYVKLPAGANKLAAQAKKCVNLGIDTKAKGWRIWDPDSHRVFVRWNVKFIEDEFPWRAQSPVGGVISCGIDDDEPVPASPVPALPVLSDRPALPAPPAPIPVPVVPAAPASVDHAGLPEPLDEVNDAPLQEDDDNELVEPHDVEHEPEPPAVVPAPRYPLRENRGVPALKYGSADEEIFSANVECAPAAPTPAEQMPSKYPDAVMEEAPKNRRAALASPNAKYWLMAEQEELARFSKYQALEPVDVLPPGAHVIGGHFVYALKTNAAFVVVKFKARYVADGNRQEPLVDYKRTKSDVADSKSFRMCLLAGSIYRGHFFQVDVDSAYLQSAPLKEKIYINAPPGYATKYARAHKPIYGLAQSGWYFRKTINRSLVEAIRNS